MWKKYYINDILLYSLQKIQQTKTKSKDNRLKIIYNNCNLDHIINLLKNIDENTIKIFEMKYNTKLDNKKKFNICIGFELIIVFPYYRLIISNHEYLYEFYLSKIDEKEYSETPENISESHMFGYKTWSKDGKIDLTDYVNSLKWSDDIDEFYSSLAYELIMDSIKKKNIISHKYGDNNRFKTHKNNYDKSDPKVYINIDEKLKTISYMDILNRKYNMNEVLIYHKNIWDSYLHYEAYIIFIKLDNSVLCINLCDDDTSCAGHHIELDLEEYDCLEDYFNQKESIVYEKIYKNVINKSFFVEMYPIKQAYL